MILKIVLLFIFIFVTSVVLFFFWGSSGILKNDELSGIKKLPHKKSEYIPGISPIRIMTFNCGYFSGMKNNLPGVIPEDFYKKNIDNFYEIASVSGAEIICLQEIDLDSKRSHYIDQSYYLADKLSFMNHAFAVNWNKKYVPFPYWPPSANFGKMVSAQSIVSKYPILDSKRIVLKRADNPFYYDRFYLDRLIQDVKIKLGDNILTILNIHMEAFDRKTREDQSAYVLEYYKKNYKNRGPVIILGDFNCVPPDAIKKTGFSDEPETNYINEKTIELFHKEESLSEAYPDNNRNECTFPSLKPDRKLDYIFFTDEYIEFIKAAVYRTNSSDHLPVIMEFILKK